jgi:EAL domain-containing protein (putative c-di-GMP-specific phosphodiesterase class I)
VPFEDQAACFAFQPIVDPVTQRITAVEALLRGHQGEPPDAVLNRYTGHAQHLFDFQSKASAFALARRLQIAWPLSINLLPSSLLAVDNAAELLLAEAHRHGFGPRDFIVEITEEEAISNPEQFMRATDALRGAGIAIAIDDFGAGFAGLSLLAWFQPDRLKIDRTLVCGVDKDGPRQAILRAIVDCCTSLGIKLICEGVESEAELCWLLEHDIHDFQGFLFARPLKAGIPAIHWPNLGSAVTDADAVLRFAHTSERDSHNAPNHAQVDATVANPARLRAVRSLGFLDAPHDATLDRLVRVAAQLTRAPVAFLTLVDETRDFYVAQWGMGEPLASRRQLEGRTYCHYALLSGGPLILEDVAAQDVFRDVPTVQTLGVRAYIGVPLVLRGGCVVGSFCAIDFEPRRWTEDDITVLTEMAQSALREFEFKALSRNALKQMAHLL